MVAGFKYNIELEIEQEERYGVSTCVRRRGPYKLDTINLVAGTYLLSFTPIEADIQYLAKNNYYYNKSAFNRWNETAKDKVFVAAMMDRLTHKAFLVNVSDSNTSSKKQKKIRKMDNCLLLL